MAGRPLRPATRRSHGGPLPRHQADRTRPHPIPMNLSQKDMHPTGASGITTRFQELFRCMGQVGHALLTRSPLSRPEQAPADPVRLACVKHAASVHPEPESNPPQKNLCGKPTCDSRNKKIDDRLIRKGASHKNLTVLQGLPATRKERTMNWQSLTIKK